jgi:ketosteroid isomerase-like protein
MPTGEDNRAVVRRLFEALNTGNDASLDELVAPDCEIIGPAGAGRGPAIY